MSNERTPLISGTASLPPEESSAVIKFRQAVGINPSTPTLTSHLESIRKNKKRSGTYKAVVSQQRKYLLQFHVIESLYYVALLTQLVIGATLASLGPLSQLHPVVVTVLGIVNSCIAGVLAILKGQAVPDRLKKNEFEMRKVKEFIEQCERRLAIRCADEITTEYVDGLVKKVFDRYNAARDTTEMNRPNSYAVKADVESGNSHGNDEMAVDQRRQSKTSDGGKTFIS